MSMNRKRIGIYGVQEETIRLVRLLAKSPESEVVRCFDPDRDAALARAKRLGSDFSDLIEPMLTDDLESFLGADRLDAVVEAGPLEPLVVLCPDAVDPSVQVVSPLTARLLWRHGATPADRKTELLQALAEVVESVEFTIDSDELFMRMLEIAVGITGAEGGSLMLLDPESRELRIGVAIGIERELWPKIRVPLGEGIAGQVAATAEPLLLRGQADDRAFQLQRERQDVKSALCVPMLQDGRVLGVLNLHHSDRSNAFCDEDVEFLQQLAGLDAKIIHRAQEHATLRRRAAHYEAVTQVRSVLGESSPLPDRLQNVCKLVADRMGNGIVNIYLCDPASASDELLLTATSLAGGGFGGEYRIVKGHGVDGSAAQSEQPIFLHDEHGGVAYAAIPLVMDQQLLGVLATQAGSTPPTEKSTEEGLLEVAEALAEGVASSHREANMQARATRLNAISETGMRLLASVDLDEIARLATSSLAMILDADHAVMRLQDEETQRYRISAYFGTADEALQPRLFQLDRLTCVETIKRRTSFLTRDIADVPSLAEFADDFTSSIASPLKIEGDIVGTIAIYDKVAIDRFFVGRFNDEDVQIFSKFIGYVERALTNARLHAARAESSSHDPDTGLPNERYLDTRIREEIARAEGRSSSFALVSCCIENWDEILERTNPAHSHHVLIATVNALRSTLRDFDVLARTGEDKFAILMPEPGLDPDSRVANLTHAVADKVCRDETLNELVGVSLAFGHAVHPANGADAAALRQYASEPRIRMV
jgi:diguanylate cyclase (GGDEF)-like protein